MHNQQGGEVGNTWEEFLRWEAESRDTIDVKKIYADVAGDLVAGIMLSQIIYWHLPDKKGQTKLRVIRDGEQWLAKGRSEWWEECRISERQADQAIRYLKEKQLVKVELHKFNG